MYCLYKGCDFSLVIYRNTLNINKIDKFSHLFSALSSLFVFNQCSQCKVLEDHALEAALWQPNTCLDIH